MNEIQQNIASMEAAFAQEILKAKAHFVHVCLAAILPKELYELAAADNQIPRCEAWAKQQGYYWEEKQGVTYLMKGDLIVGEFRPTIEGPIENRHCVFLAIVMGKPVNVAGQNPLLN